METITKEKTANPVKIGGDTIRMKILKEINELSYIPECVTSLSGVLEEIKTQHAQKIDEYKKLKEQSERDLGEKIERDTSTGGPYFFELIRTTDITQENAAAWEVRNFMLNVDGRVLDMIFDGLIAKIDNYSSDPNKILEETIESTTLNRKFQVRFSKSSDTRVVGVVQIIDKVEKEILVSKTHNFLKVSPVISNSYTKEKFMTLLDESSELCKDLYFALQFNSLAQEDKKYISQDTVNHY